jgi:hypothetical protein
MVKYQPTPHTRTTKIMRRVPASIAAVSTSAVIAIELLTHVKSANEKVIYQNTVIAYSLTIQIIQIKRRRRINKEAIIMDLTKNPVQNLQIDLLHQPILDLS